MGETVTETVTEVVTDIAKQVKSNPPTLTTAGINLSSFDKVLRTQPHSTAGQDDENVAEDGKPPNNKNKNGIHSIQPKQKAFNVADCLGNLVKFVKKHNLEHIIGATGEALEDKLRSQAEIAATLPERLDFVSPELAMSLAVLSLYDMAVLIDDSSSMEFVEVGKRIDTLKSVLEVLANIYGAVSNQERGIRAIRFLNGKDDLKADNIKTREEIDAVIDAHEFEGVTRIGTALMMKILKPFIFKEGEKWDKKAKIPRALRDLQRPMLIMVITDGAVDGEPPNRLKQAIKSVVDALRADSRFVDKASEPGPDSKERKKNSKAVVFQFARVGNDMDAAECLSKLDNEEEVADYVDTMSGKDLMDILGKRSEGKEIQVKDQQLMIKLMMGPILENYDRMDNNADEEATNSDDEFDDDEDEAEEHKEEK